MKKMECPICKKKALFVGVHDDEGNYHGLVGCEYENDPWSGLSYALHHEGWGDCPLCTDGAYSTMGGMLFDTAEDAISALSPPNEPLTIEELREMNGEPVWVERENAWGIVEIQEGKPFIFGTNFECGYSPHWNIYRRPPEGEA